MASARTGGGRASTRPPPRQRNAEARPADTVALIGGLNSVTTRLMPIAARPCYTCVRFTNFDQTSWRTPSQDARRTGPRCVPYSSTRSLAQPWRKSMRVVYTTLLGVSLVTPLVAADWPQWRGPLGTGVSSETGLPEKWNAQSVAWRVKLRGVGVSSPVVAGDAVYVTSQIGRGKRREGNHPALVQGAEAATAGERTLGDDKRGRNGHVRGRRLQPEDGQGTVALRGGGGRRPRRGSRQAQPRHPEPGDGRQAGVRVVRHRSARCARHAGPAQVEETSRQGVAILDQLGPRELAGAL